jgi:hypothetical protein
MSSSALAVEAMEANDMIENGMQCSSVGPYPVPESDPPMCEQIASIYRKRSKSLSSLFHFRHAGNKAEVVTPFLDPTNSRISVFIGAAGDDFHICDGGLANRIVEMAGRPDGKTILREMVKDYGLTVSDNSLHVLSGENDLLAKQFRLCNALVSLRDRLSTEPVRPV